VVVLIFEGAVAKARNELAVHENGMKQDFILAYDRAVDLRDGRDIPEWKKRGRERFARLVKAEAKSSLVDIGCGTGIHAVYFREEGIDVRCIDLSPGNVERRRAKGLKAYQCDVPELKSLGLTFDSGFAMNSLVHVPRGQLQEALNAIRDTLKPTGLFYWGQYGGEIREGVYE
jgi:SAM-dependent methyltransferase